MAGDERDLARTSRTQFRGQRRAGHVILTLAELASVVPDERLSLVYVLANPCRRSITSECSDQRDGGVEWHGTMFEVKLQRSGEGWIVTSTRVILES